LARADGTEVQLDSTGALGETAADGRVGAEHKLHEALALGRGTTPAAVLAGLRRHWKLAGGSAGAGASTGGSGSASGSGSGRYSGSANDSDRGNGSE
jgi:hypothetical protein